MLPKIIKLINNTKAIFKIDSEPTKGSNNLVTSGSIYKALKSSCNSATIVLNPDWESGTFPARLDSVTTSALPKLQHHADDINEYITQLPLFYVIIPQEYGAYIDTTVYPCTLKRVYNPGGGEKFIWEPTDEAPFTKIEVGSGLGTSSWQWLIYTE